jgi:transcriptional regulator with XRE-family HTH domain
MTPEELPKKLGEKIKSLRKAKKLSTRELAFASSIEKSNLVRIESGRSCPSPKTLLKIADGLELKLKDIFDFKY